MSEILEVYDLKGKFTEDVKYMLKKYSKYIKPLK